MSKPVKECTNFDGGVCYAKWEPTEGNPTGFYGEGCELTVKDSCPHYKPMDTQVNLCSTCVQHVAECDVPVYFLEFGDNAGNDNIIKCPSYKPQLDGGAG